jgi:hypothetical protein
MFKALPLLLLLGCAEHPYTWGDTAQAFSESYCSGLVACGALAPEREERCVEHNKWHMCDAQATCEIEVNEAAAQDALDACDAALQGLENQACFLLGFYGVTPPECSGIFEIRPETPK